MCHNLVRGRPQDERRRGLREGDLRAAARRRPRLDDRARGPPRRDAGVGLGDGQATRRARAGQPRALPGCDPHRGGGACRAGSTAPPPPARALPRRDARRPVGPRARGGRGARARPLGGPRGPHRGQARQPDPGPARRPDPDGRPPHRRGRNGRARRARARRRGRLRADLRQRPGDAALPPRPRHRGRRALRGRRQAAVRRTGLRALRPRHACARRRAGARDAGGAPPVSPTPPPGAEAAALRLPVSDLQRLRRRGRLRTTLGVLGPAFVACIAYVDPGNFATNIAGGAQYGYLLLWVLLAANLMAMLIQNLSAKVGIATGHNLPELCRMYFPRPVSIGLWVQAELIAMATDLAEFVGAAIALNLLFGVPMFHAGLITAVVAFGILALQGRGYRRFEMVIAGLLGVIILGFLYDTLRIGFDASDAARGFIPGFQGTESVLLATGILGATVMPHVIYLHSALTQHRIAPRDDGERRELLRFQRLDVTVAMGLAGLVNIAMLVIAASLFHAGGLTHIDAIDEAYDQFKTLVGGGAAFAFAFALLASGLASSSVGTFAGQVVMQGFIARTIPLALRRLVTMTPALIVLALGLDPSRSLVISQVVLSFGIPFALVPLVILTRRRDVMGALVNRRATTALATVVAMLIIALNGFLLYETLL